jgi:hypothetical protein
VPIGWLLGTGCGPPADIRLFGLAILFFPAMDEALVVDLLKLALPF